MSPTTSSGTAGVSVPTPTRLFAASTTKVLVSTDELAGDSGGRGSQRPAGFDTAHHLKLRGRAGRTYADVAIGGQIQPPIVGRIVGEVPGGNIIGRLTPVPALPVPKTKSVPRARNDANS